MRLVDADAIEMELGVEDRDLYVQHILDSTPTIEAEPIKHGQWIESWGGIWHSCSVCGGIPPFNMRGDDIPTPYCPHCGAKMDEVEE